MHEAGVTQRILDAALERAAAAGAKRIDAVFLEIGAESDVAPEAVEHYWAELSHGTPAEGATLLFERVAEPEAFRLVAIEVP